MERTFNKYKKLLLSLIGHTNAINGKEVNDICKRVIGPSFIGVFPQDVVPINMIKKLKECYFVVNTDLQNGSGIHWIGCYKGNGKIYIYDSFARSSITILPHLIKDLKGIPFVESDRSDKEQFGSSSICGALTISWLMCIKDYGIKKAITI